MPHLMHFHFVAPLFVIYSAWTAARELVVAESKNPVDRAVRWKRFDTVYAVALLANRRVVGPQKISGRCRVTISQSRPAVVGWLGTPR